MSLYMAVATFVTTYTNALKEKCQDFLIGLPIIHHMILDKSFHPFYFNVMTQSKNASNKQLGDPF